MPVNPWKNRENLWDDVEFLKEVAPEIYEYERKKLQEKLKRRKIKIGRICYTCKYRIGKARSDFIICRHENKKKPIWEKAHCNKWRLTRDPRRLSQYEKFVDTKYLLRNPEILNWYYYKSTKEKVSDEVQIKLGRCCFVCKYRGLKKRNMVECRRRKNRLIWEKAACRMFKLVDDWSTLDQYRKYMNRSGIDTSSTDWIKHRQTAKKIDWEKLMDEQD